jgi:hypothetical protein
MMAATVQRVEELLTTAVDQDIVILNMATNEYLALDGIGRRIWELLAQPQRVGDLCLQLTAEFAGPPEQIAMGVVAFPDELVQAAVVHVVHPAQTARPSLDRPLAPARGAVVLGRLPRGDLVAAVPAGHPHASPDSW